MDRIVPVGLSGEAVPSSCAHVVDFYGSEENGPHHPDDKVITRTDRSALPDNKPICKVTVSVTATS